MRPRWRQAGEQRVSTVSIIVEDTAIQRELTDKANRKDLDESSSFMA